MTYYAALFHKDINTTSPVHDNSQKSSNYITFTSSNGGTINILKNTNSSPIFINSNNSILPNNAGSYFGDYSNYVIVNNGSSNWILTLPLGAGSATAVWAGGASTMQISIKKTGSGTLTIQTPSDTIGTRVRGINTISNKSYTLSLTTEQTITLLYSSSKDELGTTNSTYEIWHVI